MKKKRPFRELLRPSEATLSARFSAHLRCSEASYIRAYFWLALYRINEWVFRRQHWEQFLWNQLKCEWFYVAGKCQHSGYCCQGLQLVYKGLVIRSKEEWHQVKDQDSCYDRFDPHYESGEIQHFSCRSLMPNQWCSDYENRPHFCRTYPMSQFMQEDQIHQGCGFFVHRKGIEIKTNSPGLKKRLAFVLANNRAI